MAGLLRRLEGGSGHDRRRDRLKVKLVASEMAVRVTEQAIRIHGGAGIMREYSVGRFHRDLLVYIIGEGTSEIQRNIISRSLRRDGRQSSSGRRPAICPRSKPRKPRLHRIDAAVEFAQLSARTRSADAYPFRRPGFEQRGEVIRHPARASALAAAERFTGGS